MPIYEYACQKCGAHTEILQKITDKPLTKCPQCGGKVEKQWSQTSFQLKGSGWYVTDYAKQGAAKKEGAEAKSETADKAGDAPATTTGGETKSDAAKEKPAKKKQPSASSSGKD